MTVKKALGFGLLGIPIGIAISTTIALAISLFFGSYSPVSPPLIDLMGGLMNAALFQYLASAALGFICGFGSAIWAVERWSLLRKTLIHFDLYPAAHLHCLPLGSSQFYQHTDLFRGFRGALPDYLDCPVPDYPAQNFQNERPSL